MYSCKYHRAYNIYYLVLRYVGIDDYNSSIQRQRYIYMTLCTEHKATCSFYGTTVTILCSKCT